MLYTVDSGVLARCIFRFVNLLHQGGQQDVTDQTALSTSRYSRDCNKASKWNLDTQIFKVVLASAPN